MLKIEDVTRRWSPSFALRNVNLHIGRGEFFVLLGPSGAGKTLLLELIAGFHRINSGRIHIGRRDVTALPPEKRNVGFVYQDQMLFPHKTVRQNIAYGLNVRGADRDTVAASVERLARMLHVDAILDHPSTQLSIGQKQRVCLARALAIEPDLLLLDEPFSALDAPLKKTLCLELKRLHGEMGLTALHVTHDRAEAQMLGQRIGVIQNGRIQQVGVERSVFDTPDTHFVAEFTGGTNIYTGHAREAGDLVEFTNGPLTLVTTHRLTGPCKALVRPENIIISREPIHTSARNQIAGTVESVARHGDLCDVTLQVGDAAPDPSEPGADRITCVITPLSVQELGIEPGVQAFFSFKVGSVHLFQEETA
jgi:molybdate/tungstate transport system ATP-binding protein